MMSLRRLTWEPWVGNLFEVTVGCIAVSAFLVPNLITGALSGLSVYYTALGLHRDGTLFMFGYATNAERSDSYDKTQKQQQQQPAKTSSPSKSKKGSGLGNIEVSSPSPNHSTQEALFLLTCMSHDTYTTHLLQLDLGRTFSDSQLFTELNRQYMNLRIYSLKTVRDIKFVQFELHRRALVDIRKRDNIPPESWSQEYRYNPIPAELMPPIGSNYLMHIYQHPEDADLHALCLARFPKRVNERLHMGPYGVAKVGWGIHLAEGFALKKVWILGGIMTLASIVFGISWAALRKDIQGGFAVSAVVAMLVWGIGSLETFTTQ